MSQVSPSDAFAVPAVESQIRPDGSRLLSSPQALETFAPSLGHWLVEWAEKTPERPFLAERTEANLAERTEANLAERTGPTKWRVITYSEALQQVESLAQALLDQDLSADRPLALLSGNSADHALLQLAAMHVGIPAVPISPAYSLMSKDHDRLRYILDLIQPGMIYASDGELFAGAFNATAEICAARLVSTAAEADALVVASLMGTRPNHTMTAAHARVGPDSVGKILFTSGSTGIPKGVLNTQRMMCSNQQAIRQLWPFLAEEPPIIVDWLPWSHTFGGNHNFNMVLRNGGTLFIDDGKPVPGAIQTTVDNLREIAPTLYFNVPRGFDVLIPFLEQDTALRDHFFSRLSLIFYAAAALPQNLWTRLEALSIASRGEKIAMVSAWGSTETAPLATSVYFPIERAGVIGLPAPGTEIKLVPTNDKDEMRVRGPNVTPGYFRRDDLTAKAFDEEGFFRTGDAGRFADPDDPSKGLVFDGRIAESFKLLSGTWVRAGAVRVAVIAATEPIIQDAVIAGHDRDHIGLLIFPNLEGCRSLCDDAADMPLEDLVHRQEVRDALREKLTAYNREHPGNSQRVDRALLLTEPPSIDANEITDKGYINQRAVLDRRSALVERLFSSDADDVLILD